MRSAATIWVALPTQVQPHRPVRTPATVVERASAGSLGTADVPIMTVFRNDTHEGVWIERWCDTCFEPHRAAQRIQGRDTECPILARYLKRKRKPMEWERQPRQKDMDKTVKCTEYQSKPAATTRAKAQCEDVPMFDIEPHEAHLVPVEGWPERPRKKDKEGDHA